MRRQYDFSRAKRGAVVKTPSSKSRITIRLDDDVLDWFRDQAHRSGGASYQNMINNALHQFIQDKKEPLEKILRRVVREELAARKAAG